MGRLDNKVAIITGAANGCGEVSAKLFASEGAKVVVADLSDEQGNRVVEKINKEYPGCAIFSHLNVSLREDWKKTIELTKKTFGELNIVVNNAGISYRENIWDSNDDVWNKTIAVNQRGVYLGMQYGIKAIAENGKPGAIVSTASVDGHVGDSIFFTYCATKAAVESMTRCAALYCGENKLNIRVNAVGPGYMLTPMAEDDAKQNGQTLEEYCADSIALHPIGRLANPKEIAEAYLWLVSDKASFVTGTTLMADGGYTAR